MRMKPCPFCGRTVFYDSRMHGEIVFKHNGNGNCFDAFTFEADSISEAEEMWDAWVTHDTPMETSQPMGVRQ